ncbi:GIY-YIG nuclease family protein [Bacillus subtilis]|uniref:GIY-YIG nuclease family protein n=1 Tax=Bacillus subtilis TaxID=1423 RepID=UPI00077E506C|nr:GIY-YIG nuclease family protein [Bacillus subtilis]AMR46825.1 hypothetical protein KHRBS_10335 [Bacillus subtilis subsp. subtilis]AOA54436.1 hypothetical protein BSHJ0_01864 [Bacillus subtilis]MCF7606452.1 GIY-YIG nuclease family protein [Bacillus subtilis]MCF7612930.1 GIY-YIG nuclease family protein [Bacillus subtilis]QHF58113.1 endonuclease 1 [Bacillus subtilis]
MKFINEDEHKYLSGIYKIEQISTGLIYVGKTKMKFIKRYWHHTWKLKNNSHCNRHLQNNWNKYGENDFQFHVLQTVDPNSDMNELETHYINELGAYLNGFNMTTGGEGKSNCKMSDSTKKIIGEKNRINNIGRKLSDETKAKMSKARIGRKLSPQHKEKLLQSRMNKRHSPESRLKMRQSHLGSKNKSSKINETKAHEIKVRLINGEKMSEVSKSMRVSYPIVKSILQCKVWNHIHVTGWDDFILKYKSKKKSTLTPEEVLCIRELLKKGLSAPHVAKMCNIKPNVVYGIKQGRTYKNVK